jgi:hypothetical protein
MKQVILAAAVAIVATAAQAQATNPNNAPGQAYTTLGPAGAGSTETAPSVTTTGPPARRIRTPAPSAPGIRATD